MIELNLTANGVEQELILDYLLQSASTTLADKINNGTPFIKDGKELTNKKDLESFMSYACNYAKEQTKKGARYAMVDDKTVFGWAIHYFEENEIEGVLYNDDGSEYKPKPPQRPVAKANIAKKETKPQMSFEDFINEQAQSLKESSEAVTEKTLLNDLSEIDKLHYVDSDGLIHWKESIDKLVSVFGSLLVLR